MQGKPFEWERGSTREGGQKSFQQMLFIIGPHRDLWVFTENNGFSGLHFSKLKPNFVWFLTQGKQFCLIYPLKWQLEVSAKIPNCHQRPLNNIRTHRMTEQSLLNSPTPWSEKMTTVAFTFFQTIKLSLRLSQKAHQRSLCSQGVCKGEERGVLRARGQCLGGGKLCVTSQEWRVGSLLRDLYVPRCQMSCEKVCILPPTQALVKNLLIKEECLGLGNSQQP